MKNYEKTKAQALDITSNAKTNKHQLTVTDLNNLMEQAAVNNEELFNALLTAYYIGVTAGYKIAKAEDKE